MFIYQGQADEAICLSRPWFLPMMMPSQIPPHVHNISDPDWAGIWPVPVGSTVLVDPSGQAHIVIVAEHIVVGIGSQ